MSRVPSLQDRLAHAVGDARLQLLEAGVLAPDPLAGREADAAAALLDRRDQVRQERRIVLAVAVERRHDGAARGAHAAAHRRRLTGRNGMPELPQLRVLLHQRRQPLGGRVRRAVIDIDDLVGPAAVERGRRFPRSAARRCPPRCARAQRWKRRPHLCRKMSNRHSSGWFGQTRNRAYRAAWRRPLLWGESAPGNPFEAPGRGPDKGHNGAVALDRKSEPPGRKPVAHEHRADDADQRAGHDVARMMGQQHQTASPR